MKIDLHTHSSVSDGTDTPTGLVMKALNAGLDVIALTDHDTFDGVAEAQEAGKRIGVRGGSVIIDPWGRVLASAASGEAVIAAEVDAAVLRDARERLPVRAHQRFYVPG